MVSVSNPNIASRNRLAAREAKSRKQRNQRAKSAQTKISLADARLGAKPGLLPTSGPRARISKKKMRKIERGARHALKRRLEKEGEIEMRDAPVEDKSNKSKKEEAPEVEMDDIA